MNTQDLMNRAQKALSYVESRGGVIQLEPEETAAIKAMAKGYASFMTPAGEVLLDDIETRHAIHGKGLRTPPMPGGRGTRDGTEIKGVKVHHGAQGEVFELASSAKLASVMKSAEKAPVALDRWLTAAMLGDRCEDKAALDYAQDVKSMSTGSTGILLPVGYQAEWADNIRAQMVLQAAGMRTATMNAAQVTSSRIIADPTVSWRSEGGTVAASDPTFELQNLIARSLAVRVKSTVELAQDSPEWGSQLMAVMTKALATEIDRVGLVGSGVAPQPRGIFNTSGVNSVAAVGDIATAGYGSLIDGLQALLEANCDLPSVEGNAIMSPRSWAGWENLRATDNQPLARPKALENMTFRPTTAVPNNLGAGTDKSVAFLGDFTQMVLGVRMEATIEALKVQSYADNLLLEFVGWTRVDFLVRRPASFVMLTGIN